MSNAQCLTVSNVLIPLRYACNVGLDLVFAQMQLAKLAQIQNAQTVFQIIWCVFTVKKLLIMGSKMSLVSHAMTLIVKLAPQPTTKDVTSV